MIPFSDVWQRIILNGGKVFYTKRMLKFKYQVKQNAVLIDRVEYTLTRKDFMSAFRHVPLEGPGELIGLVHGQNYIWAILHDKRIRMNDW
jgi:hypothetical protein